MLNILFVTVWPLTHLTSSIPLRRKGSHHCRGDQLVTILPNCLWLNCTAFFASFHCSALVKSAICWKALKCNVDINIDRLNKMDLQIKVFKSTILSCTGIWSIESRESEQDKESKMLLWLTLGSDFLRHCLRLTEIFAGASRPSLTGIVIKGICPSSCLDRQLIHETEMLSSTDSLTSIVIKGLSVVVWTAGLFMKRRCCPALTHIAIRFLATLLLAPRWDCWRQAQTCGWHPPHHHCRLRIRRTKMTMMVVKVTMMMRAAVHKLRFPSEKVQRR